MIIIKGGVTAPDGFLASAVKAGIKKSGRLDLALLYSEVNAVAAGAFTTNRFQASPVTVSKAHLRAKLHQAVIVNSGNANCANGREGDVAAILMAGLAARSLGLDTPEVLVASTGIIGRPMPIDKIKRAIPSLVTGLSQDGGDIFSKAILTTDTVKKEFAVKIKLGSSIVTVGGCCKGVGMIHPLMKTEKPAIKKAGRHATTLSFLTTDASISKKMLESALEEAMEDSFNMVSVDGDMSTNDTCLILANGLAGNARIDSKGDYYHKFAAALKFLTEELAKMLARDGEGATKFVEIKVVGAHTKADAVKMARSVSTSSLLKCCIYGEDPNWGRVVAAAGASDVDFDTAKTDLYFGEVKVLSNGLPVKNCDLGALRKIFKKKAIAIKIDLKSGKASATGWTCDFSKKYVAINSEYST